MFYIYLQKFLAEAVIIVSRPEELSYMTQFLPAGAQLSAGQLAADF